MKLNYNKELPSHREIKERLDTLTLAYSTESITTTEVRLQDGAVFFSGEAEIAKHIDEIAGELHSWYYCHC